MKTLGTVRKNAADKRSYKAIELPNKVVCRIISNPQAEKSSAALSVQAGSLQDPPDAQGLTHYLQHMLFMSTSKYPNQNEYSYFSPYPSDAKNSGDSNGQTQTSQSETNYEPRDMLDRFAQFFIGQLGEGAS